MRSSSQAAGRSPISRRAAISPDVLEPMNDRAPDSETFLALQEIVAAARRKLAPGPWGYLIGGAETETTVRRNRLAIDSLAFRPRVLRDVRRVDATSVFLDRP